MTTPTHQERAIMRAWLTHEGIRDRRLVVVDALIALFQGLEEGGANAD